MLLLLHLVNFVKMETFFSLTDDVYREERTVSVPFPLTELLHVLSMQKTCKVLPASRPLSSRQLLLCMTPVQPQTALSATMIPTPELFQAASDHRSRENIAGLCRINIRIVFLVLALVNVQSVCEARTGISFTSPLYSHDHFKRIQSLLLVPLLLLFHPLVSRFNLPFDSMFVQHNSNDILLIVRNLLKFKRRLNFWQR